MEKIGIIAEYNPFHNGHLYHLKKIKEMYPDSLLVLILSGNFTQRGEPSLIDKWTKTEIALVHSIDLVIELPFPFATQSADQFAKGAISILKQLEVDKLIFGSESNDINNLKEFANIQLHHPEYQTLASIYLKEGYNYPTALSKALLDLTGKNITLPNDLLGLSYVKEILRQNSRIEPICIQRTTDYHDQELESSISSATSIRKARKENKQIKQAVPDITYQKLKQNVHFLDDYFPFLKYKILTSKDLSIYQTVDEGIENRLKKAIVTATCFNDLIQKIKTKRYTYNKLQRMLLHILCDFTKEEAKKFQEIAYIRVLGMNKKGRIYLNQQKKKTTVPIISNYARLKHDMLALEFRATCVYASTLEENKKILLFEEEYKHYPRS